MKSSSNRLESRGTAAGPQHLHLLSQEPEMSELRKDPIVDRWVIVAENRSSRPSDFESVPQKRAGRICPFCEGNETHTPPEILALREPGTHPDRKGWRVRVVPNKFPALVMEGDVDRRGDGLYAALPGVGAHEVIIESPRHVTSTSELSETELADVLLAYRERLRQLKQDRRLAYGMVFKNVGPAAGATMEHLHAQLIALPIVPINVWEEMNGSLKYYDYRGCCAYCEMIERELSIKHRVVVESPGYLSFCPFAGRFAFETWIVPKKHSSRYENCGEADLNDLSVVLKKSIEKLESALEKPAYNYIIHTAPFDTDELGHYHWHIEIMPQLAKAAGFEWGTGFYVNPVAPETAAKVLRGV
jgi:UDPglucose--hexose-1-phosphate uridylyltransferase